MDQQTEKVHTAKLMVDCAICRTAVEQIEGIRKTVDAFDNLKTVSAFHDHFPGIHSWPPELKVSDKEERLAATQVLIKMGEKSAFVKLFLRTGHFYG